MCYSDLGNKNKLFIFIINTKKRSIPFRTSVSVSDSDWARTNDLYPVKVALSQLSYGINYEINNNIYNILFLSICQQELLIYFFLSINCLIYRNPANYSCLDCTPEVRMKI